MCWVTNNTHVCTALAKKHQHFQIVTAFTIKITYLPNVWLFFFVLFK